MVDRKYDSILYDFFEKENGTIILLSEDTLFKKVLSTTLYKTVGTKKECLWTFDEVGPALKKIKTQHENATESIVFIERMIQERPSTDTILTLKQLLPDLRVIVLANETKRENIAYFYEIGVNNVISKPASINNIIEKIAFTLKPQGKLSEYMSIGKRFLATGKFKEAIEVSNKILSIKPDSPAGLMLRGDVFLEKGENEKAISSYMQAHESSKLYLEPLKRLANAYKDVDDAKHLEFLKRLDRLSPLNVERKTGIGKVHIKQDQHQTAEKYFDKALEIAHKEAMSTVSHLAMQISEAIGQSSPQMSEKYLTRAIEAKGDNLTKDDIALFNKRGIALRGQAKWRDAIENYLQAIKISPEDEGLYYNMGMAHFDGNERSNASQCFDKALELNPDFYIQSETVSMNLGEVYASIREYGKAKRFYDKAAEINPHNKTAARKSRELSHALN